MATIWNREIWLNDNDYIVVNGLQSMARISYVDRAELPPEYKHLPFHKPEDSDDLPEEYRHLLQQDERNIHRILNHSPPLFQAFKDFNGVLWNEIDLTPHEIEKCILTIARHLESKYEWHAHVRIGLYEGLTPEEINVIAEGSLEDLPKNERALLLYITRVLDGTVRDDDIDDLMEHYSEATIVEATVLASCYLLMERVLSAFDVDVEEDFVGWNLENL